MLGVAAWAAVIEMVAGGAFDLALEELDSVSVPTTTSESAQLAGMLSLSRSLVAAADRRPADVDAALEHAAELAQRTGQGNAYLMGFRTYQRGAMAHERCARGQRLRTGGHHWGKPESGRASKPRASGHLLDGLWPGVGPHPGTRG